MDLRGTSVVVGLRGCCVLYDTSWRGPGSTLYGLAAHACYSHEEASRFGNADSARSKLRFLSSIGDI